MSEITTVSLELHELCEALTSLPVPEPNSQLAMHTLMAHFNVSTHGEFYEVFTCIFDRIDICRAQITQVTGNVKTIQLLTTSLDQIESSLSPQMMARIWRDGGANYINSTYSNPLLLISHTLESHFPLPKISIENIEKILTEAENLKEFIKLQQLTDNSPIRSLMLEGIDKFCFRLKRFQWIGVGFTMDSINWLLAATTTLAQSESAKAEDAEILKKAKSLLKNLGPYFNAGKSSYSNSKLIIAAAHGIAGFLS